MNKEIKNKLNSCDIAVLVMILKLNKEKWNELVNRIANTGGIKNE